MREFTAWLVIFALIAASFALPLAWRHWHRATLVVTHQTSAVYNVGNLVEEDIDGQFEVRP